MSRVNHREACATISTIVERWAAIFKWLGKMAVGLTSALAIKSVAISCNEKVSESTACQENEGNVLSGVKTS